MQVDPVGGEDRGGLSRAIPGLAVFAIAAAVRLWLARHAAFGLEESIFYAQVRDLASGTAFPLLGPPVTAGEARHPGPLFFWILAPSQWVSRTPEAAYAMVALLGAATVWLFWSAIRRSGFGAWGSGLAGLMMALSPWSVFYADRVWNSNVVGILVGMAFWAAVRVRQDPSSRWVALLVFAAMVMPQVHLSAPVVWAALLVFVGRRRVDLRWAALGVALGLVAYGPYLAHEFSSGFGNARAFLRENEGRGIRFPLAVPLYLARFLTLDSAYFEMSAHSIPMTEFDILRAAVLGDATRPFHALRLASLVASIVLAVATLICAVKSPASRPFGRALGAGFLASIALLGWSGKVVFPHYVQPLLPFLFAAFATLPRRAWVVALVLVFAAGAMDAVAMVAWHMDDKNNLPVHRRIIERLLREPEQKVRLAIGFQGYDHSYQVLSDTSYEGRLKVGSEGPLYVLVETDGRPAPPVTFADIDPVGPVRLEVMEAIGPVTLYRGHLMGSRPSP